MDERDQKVKATGEKLPELKGRMLERYLAGLTEEELLQQFTAADLRGYEVEAIMARLEEMELPQEVKSEMQYHYLQFKKYNK